jgi:hypothetical protein
MRDERAYAMPAAPLTKVGLKAGDPFVMVVARSGAAVAGVVFERVPEARPPRQMQSVPKVQVRSGRKLTTRGDSDSGDS